MRVRRGYPNAIRALISFLLLSSFCQPQSQGVAVAPSTIPRESLHYGVEWRLIRAGTVKVTWDPGHAGKTQGNVDLDSAGMVAKLYRVEDHYVVTAEEQFCATDVIFEAKEGNRKRETKVTFDRTRGKSSYIEHDFVKNVSQTREVDVPKCVHDVVTALSKLRTLKMEPGKSIQLPVSDGKKMVSARIDAQEREEVTTPSGKYKTLRYEVFLFNEALYNKKGRLFLWLTDDAQRLPVQIRVQMRFPLGNITLQLEKIER